MTLQLLTCQAMTRRTWPALVGFLFLSSLSLSGDSVLAQSSGQLRGERLRGTLDVQNARIGEQRVQRQTEIMRLEGIIRGLESRMMRMERQLLVTPRLPAITIEEAEAGVEFAQAQLRETEQLHEQGEATELRVASDRLAATRARGQLQVAKAAHTESLITLELDVLYAERFLAEQLREKSQLERLVAKGYTSSDGLRLRLLDVGVAEKRLQIARLRLETLKKSAGDSSPAVDEENQDPAKAETVSPK